MPVQSSNLEVNSYSYIYFATPDKSSASDQINGRYRVDDHGHLQLSPMFWDYVEKETSSIPTTRPREAQTRSFNCVLPLLRAQWTQQKTCPSVSTPCPTIRQLQCAQTGASAWMAHSKLSKVWCSPPTTTSNALSYSFSQTSHVAIQNDFAPRHLCGGVHVLFERVEITPESDTFPRRRLWKYQSN